MESQKTFMASEVKYTNIGNLRQTRLHSVDVQLSVAGRIGMVKERLSSLTWRLHNDLSSEVFDNSPKEVVDHYRAIYDLKSLLVKIYQKGGIMIGLKRQKHL